MKSMPVISRYFSLSRGEFRGTIILLILLILVNLVRLYRPESRKIDPKQLERFRAEVAAFEACLPVSAVLNRPGPDTGQGNQRLTAYSLFDPVPDCTLVAAKGYAPSFTLELNTADTFDLQRLRGIGPSFARRIYFYRTKLGGFIQTTQLLEVFGMDSARFVSIAPYLIVNPALVSPMDLNLITFKELISHPYMPYEVAKEIALMRKKRKVISGIGELKDLKGMTDSLYNLLLPYLKAGQPAAP